MAVIIPVGSGKGGVGKTIFTANLGIKLAAAGKKTVLIDLDLGGSNLHTCLGIKNKYSGISSVINKTESFLTDLIVETGIDNLLFIPGDTLNPGTGNLQFFVKQKIIKQIGRLDADFIILDLGAGSTFNTVDFFLVSPNTAVVFTTPETTSVLNAYSFLKTSIFRMLYRCYRPRTRERDIILDFVNSKIEGSGRSFSGDLVSEITAYSAESGRLAISKISEFRPGIIINRAEDSDSINLGMKLQSITRKNIGIDLEFLGSLPEDPEVQKSIFSRMPVALSAPGSPFSTTLDRLADYYITSGKSTDDDESAVLYLDDDDDMLKIET